MKLDGEYMKELRRRSKESRVYKKYQLTGLLIAKALHDEKHKSLYIKMAKNGNSQKLLWLAKDVADRSNIQNRGAYFMAALMRTEKEARAWLKPQRAAHEPKRRSRSPLFKIHRKK